MKKLQQISYDIMVKNGNNFDRAKLFLDAEHPSGNWILVEYYLPVDGRKVQWVLKANTKPAYHMQLDWNAQAFVGTQYHIDFLHKHNFSFKGHLIDVMGYVTLTDEEQKKFWDKFKKAGAK